MKRTLLSAHLVVACMAGLVAPAQAQTTRAYTGAGTSGAPGAWLTPANWSGAVYAGSSSAVGGGSPTDIALFNNSAASVGIDMGAAGGTLSLGAINYQYSTAQVLQTGGFFSSFAIGNSSTTTAGAIQLSGATINGVANTLIAVSNVAGDGNGVGNNGNDLTIGNTVAGSAALSLQLGITNGVFNVFGDTHSTRSLFINVPVTQLSANSGFTVQGSGNVTLGGSAPNSFTGTVNIASGQLQVTNTNGLRATATTVGATTVQSGGTLYLNAAFTTADNISISGTGYTQTITSTSYMQSNLQASVYDSQPLATPTFTPIGALRLGSAGVTLNGNITLLGAGATIFVDGGTSTLNGAIGAAGPQTLEMNGAGTLALAHANTYTGATTITEGTINLTGAAGALASQSITLNNSGTLTLTNTASANSSTRLGTTTAINLNSGVFNFASDGSASAFSQAVGVLTLGNLPGIVTTSQAGTGGTSNLQFASLSPRSGTGSVIFLGAGLGTNNQNTITFTTAPTVDQGGLIGSWALYGATSTTPSDFASYSTPAATSSTPGGVVAATANTDTTGATWTAASNLKFTGGGTISVPATGGSFTGQVNSLNIQTNAATVDLTSLGGTSLRIGSGGILDAGGLTLQNGSVVAGQTANTNSEMLVSIPLSTTTTTISASIADNGSGKTGLTVQGAGTLALTSLSNSFSGPITVNGATLSLSGSGGALGANGPFGLTTSITLHQVSSVLSSGGSTLTLANSTLPSTIAVNLEGLLTGGVNGGLSSGSGAGPGVGVNGTTIGLNQRTTINAAAGTTDEIDGPIVASGNNLINFSGSGSLTLGNSATPSTISAGASGFSGALTFRGGATTVNDTINLPNGTIAFVNPTSLTINSTGNNWAITSVVSGNLLLSSDNMLPSSAVLVLGQYGTGTQVNFGLNGHSQTFTNGIANATTNQNDAIFNGAAGLSILIYNSPAISSVIINQVDDVIGPAVTSTTDRLAVVVQAGTLNLDRPNGTPYSGGSLVTGGTLLIDGGSATSTNTGSGSGPVVTAPASISVPTVFGGIGGVGGTTAGPTPDIFPNVPSALNGVTGIRIGAGSIFAPGIAMITNGNPTTAVYVTPGTPPGATTTATTLFVRSYINVTGGAAGAGGSSTNWIVGLNTGATGNTGGGTIANAANLLSVVGTGSNSDGSVNGQLNFFTTASNKINIDVEAVNNPLFTPGATLDYIIATTATAGSIFLNGAAFPTTPDSTDFTFSSSAINGFSGLSPALLANPANTSQLLVQFTASSTAWSWTGNTSGNWSVGTNWSPAVVPTGSVNTQLTFGATTHATMTNDISGTFTLNSMTFTAAAPIYTLGGNGLNFASNGSGALPQIVSNSANSVTIGNALTLTNNLTVSGTGNVTLNGAIAGAGSLTMSGTGILALGNSGNSYGGGLNIVTGTVAIPADGALGTGALTIGVQGTLDYSATTSTTRSFPLNFGTLAVSSGATLTLNGGVVSSGYLMGPGTFATSATNGAQIVNVTTEPSAAIASNNAKDQFVHVDNSAAFSLAAGVNTAGNFNTTNLKGFINEGLGSITIGAGSQLNVADFQSYGMMNLVPATVSGQFTELANLGTSPLGFNGGSQTFVGTATAPNANVVGVDLHGQNLVIQGGLFVNNGLVFTSTGSSTVFVDYGATYKGAGTTNVPIVTQNGGKVLFGNCPGVATFGSLVVGSGGIGNLEWEINDAGPSATYPNAPGVAGPTANSSNRVSGWSMGLVASQAPRIGAPTYGNLTWTATPSSPFGLELETLAGPSTLVGTNPDGLMADFDPTQSYSWPIITYEGAYNGPTSDGQLTADTLFDRSGFANAIPAGAEFSLHLDQYPTGGGELDLVFTPSPVPEPGALALTGMALTAGLTWYRRRRNT